MHLALIWYILTQNLTVRKQKLLSSGPQLKMRSIIIAKRLVVLVVFKLNVPVNSFSVMSGRSHRLCFLGEMGIVEPPRAPE